MASARDVILASVLLFIFAMGFFVINFSTRVAVDRLVNIAAINDTVAARDAFNDTASTVNRLDYLLFGLFIALLLGIIISGWFVAGNPLFMFLYFMVTTIGVVLSVYLANVWDDITSASVFTSILSGFSVVDTFPITNFIMTYLPMITAVIGILGLVVMFAKPYVERSL